MQRSRLHSRDWLRRAPSPAELDTALQHLDRHRTTERLRSHSGVRVVGTPRRLLALCIRPRSLTNVDRRPKRGPPKAARLQGRGANEGSALGFCASSGVDVSTVRFEADAKGVEYCYDESKTLVQACERGAAMNCQVRCRQDSRQA
jgi:glycyl-tRNA synthetase beta subunit